jgi:hypothetical protein
MTRYTKKQIAGHIFELFTARPETLWATRWACVIKHGKLTVVRRLYVMPTEPVIIECLLESGKNPSWLSIYYGVWKNWSKLASANVEI